MVKEKVVTLSTTPMKYTKGCKYQLFETMEVFIPDLISYDNIVCDFIWLKKGRLTLLKGFAWDGASGPTIDTKSSMRASAIHDALYKLIRQGYLPAKTKNLADVILRYVCIQDGMWEWRAGAWFLAVGKFADTAADPKNKKKIMEAP